MKKSRLLGVIYACIILSGSLISTSVVAAVVVDQSNIAPPTNNLFSVYGSREFGQTLTVGIDGILDSVDMYVDVSGTPIAGLTLEVRGVSGGLPNGTVLATTTLSSGSVINGLNIFDVSSANLSVSINDVIAIILSSPDSISSGRYLAREIPGDAYAGGIAVANSGTGWETFGSPEQGFDAIFQTKVAVVPIPAAVWLFGSGLLGLVGMARRKKA